MDFKTIERDSIKFSFVNKKEFEKIYKHIFLFKEYEYINKISSPYILDCGSHVGISLIYFKKICPSAKIIAFEPNPLTFKLLKQNIYQNNIKNVVLINAAVSNKKGYINFYISRDTVSPWSWGDSGVKNKWHSEESTKTIRVSAVKLSTHINKTVDLIKLDIEGMEEIVLKDIENKLDLVKEIIIEFHGSTTNLFNNQSMVLSLLKRNKFQCIVKQDGRIIEEHQIQKTDPYWVIIHAKNKLILK